MNKSMHIMWNEIKKKITTNNSRNNHNNKNKYKTRVDVNFYDKGTSKSQSVFVVGITMDFRLNFEFRAREHMPLYKLKLIQSITIHFGYATDFLNSHIPYLFVNYYRHSFLALSYE
jgi:hypothetical protein